MYLAVKASPTDTLRPAENNPLTNAPYILCTVLNYALLAQCMLGDSDGDHVSFETKPFVRF